MFSFLFFYSKFKFRNISHISPLFKDFCSLEIDFTYIEALTKLWHLPYYLSV